MKVIALFLTICIALVAARSYSFTNGKPGCRLQEELGRRWRNNHDPIRYWQCDNGQAVSYICPNEYLFSDAYQSCIHWSAWEWSEPYDPPTTA